MRVPFVMTSETLPISEIQIPENRARDLDHDWVEVLAEMIKETGQLNPITLREVDGQKVLVTGHHRLAATLLLERDEILYRISNAATDEEARLEEVFENLGRNELSALDRAQHLFEMKEAYEALYPAITHGGDRKSDEAKENQNDKMSFCSDAAEKCGLGERGIQRAVKIWKDLSVATKKQIRGTWIADHQATLLGLAKLSSHMQKKVLPYLLDKRASNVDEALILADNKKLPGALEKKFASIDRSLRGLEKPQLESVFSNFEGEIVEWVKARGLI